MSSLDTLAKVFSLVHQGLNAPSDPSFLLQVKRAVHEACAFYWVDLIQSDQNQNLKCTAEIPFVQNERIYSLNDYPDMTMPDWVEVKVPRNNNDDASERWDLIMVVNRDSLPLYGSTYEVVCAFYGGLDTDSRPAKLTKTIEFSYAPWNLGGLTNRYFRVWYDPSIQVTTGDDDATGFPTEFNYLLVLEARAKLYPILMQMDIEKMANDQTSEFVLKAKLESWKAMQAQTLSELGTEYTPGSWRNRWKSYKLASRVNQGGGFKRPVVRRYC